MQMGGIYRGIRVYKSATIHDIVVYICNHYFLHIMVFTWKYAIATLAVKLEISSQNDCMYRLLFLFVSFSEITRKRYLT